MRWTEQMAEAIVQLRAICLSGDFLITTGIHNIQQDQRRLFLTFGVSLQSSQYPKDSGVDAQRVRVPGLGSGVRGWGFQGPPYIGKGGYSLDRGSPYISRGRGNRELRKSIDHLIVRDRVRPLGVEEPERRACPCYATSGAG